MTDVMERTSEQTHTVEQDQRTRITSLPWPVRRDLLRQKLERTTPREWEELDEG
jgi:hypothetical protein